MTNQSVLMITFFIFLTLVLNLIPGSEGTENPPKIAIRNYAWYSDSHHIKEEDKFQNIWGKEESPGTWKTIKWVSSNIAMKSEAQNIPPLIKINPENLKKVTDSIEVYWVGHATAIVKMNQQTIITDPIFNERASIVSFSGPKRLVGFPITIDEIPQINTVIISHSHYDHCDKESLVALKNKFNPLFIVPLKLKSILNGWGITNVIELDWWQFIEVDGIRYSSTPNRHRSNRGILDINETLWSSWMMENLTNGKKVYFAGDTGYSPHFSEISEKLGSPEVALLPIGAYQPRWLMQYVHVTPQESVQAFLDLGATHMVGIHWGTFDLADEPFDEPGKIVPEIAKEKGIPVDRIHILPVGGEITF